MLIYNPKEYMGHACVYTLDNKSITVNFPKDTSGFVDVLHRLYLVNWTKSKLGRFICLNSGITSFLQIMPCSDQSCCRGWIYQDTLNLWGFVMGEAWSIYIFIYFVSGYIVRSYASPDTGYCLLVARTSIPSASQDTPHLIHPT